jgi:hypothetical protein
MGIFDEFPDEEEEPMPTTLSEPKPIEEEPIFPTIQIRRGLHSSNKDMVH